MCQTNVPGSLISALVIKLFIASNWISFRVICLLILSDCKKLFFPGLSAFNVKLNDSIDKPLEIASCHGTDAEMSKLILIKMLHLCCVFFYFFIFFLLLEVCVKCCCGIFESKVTATGRKRNVLEFASIEKFFFLEFYFAFSHNSHRSVDDFLLSDKQNSHVLLHNFKSTVFITSESRARPNKFIFSDFFLLSIPLWDGAKKSRIPIMFPHNFPPWRIFSF